MRRNEEGARKLYATIKIAGVIKTFIYYRFNAICKSRAAGECALDVEERLPFLDL